MVHYLLQVNYGNKKLQVFKVVAMYPVRFASVNSTTQVLVPAMLLWLFDEILNILHSCGRFTQAERGVVQIYSTFSYRQNVEGILLWVSYLVFIGKTNYSIVPVTSSYMSLMKL
jgi:hypothetical protein